MTLFPVVKTVLPTSSALRFGSTIGLTSLALILGTAQRSHAFSFIFANALQPNGQRLSPDLVAHQIGYNGTGGQINITVGIDQTSANASAIETATQNVINTWNNLEPTTGNLLNTLQTGMRSDQFDFESVLLHELGHSLGLGHPNLASESGLTGDNREYTASTNGTDNRFNLDAGADGIEGSADDRRGDDVNLNYFSTADNDPFDTDLGVVDSTTYSRDLANLPEGDSFSANADRDVGAALGYSNTEAVMQQGTVNGEIQRTLGADDVAGILYSLAGVDERAGTADDYTFNLTYAGLTDNANILIDFDNSKTGFAVSQNTGVGIGSNHVAITGSNIFFNNGWDWFFNDISNVGVPNSPIGNVNLPTENINLPTGNVDPPIAAAPVPTPALLPGLIGMGFSAMRKQKRELAA